MSEEQEYIAVEEAAKQIGVTRASMYYYIKQLHIETKRFQFDKKSYLTSADFQRIKDIKNASPSARKATFKKVNQSEGEAA
jgi:hypothetical protein